MLYIYSPTGTDCNWFKNCLEKKYLCSGVRDQNAITFAENFCRLYEDKSYLFSASGKQWVDAVRKCLQVIVWFFLHNLGKKLFITDETAVSNVRAAANKAARFLVRILSKKCLKC